MKRMRTPTRRGLATVVAAGLAGTGIVSATAPVSAAPGTVASVVVAAKSTPKKPPLLKVMTINLYLGGSLGGALAAASDPIKFLAAAAKVYDTAQATDFPKRAKWIAKTIKKENPHVVALNELSDWIFTSTTGADLPSYDYLTILLDALKAQGMHFKVASLSPNADLGFSDTIGIPYVNPDVPGCDNSAQFLNCQVRLKDRDAVLYNTKAKGLKFHADTSDHGNFSTQQTFEVAGRVLSFNRGWASAGFTLKGKKFTALTAHLEVESKDGQKGNYGPKVWPSAIQVAQGQQLLQIAKNEAKKTDGRVVLAGDLNTDANGYYSPTYLNLTTSYFKDSWAQIGKKFAAGAGATCCQEGTLSKSLRLNSGDPQIPTRIDLVLNHKAKATWARRLGASKMQNVQPKWQSDHYFFGAHVKLK